VSVAAIHEVDFDGLRIAYDTRLLTPREWTREQSRWAAQLLQRLPEGPVLELCSGAGHIGLRAVRDTDRRLVCVDIDPLSAVYTRDNARAAGMLPRVECRTGRAGDMLQAGERFPLVIADPPWVPHADTTRYPEDPLRAIDGGPDGLAVARECVAVMVEHLAEGGYGLLQLAPGDAQADAVSEMVGPSRLRAGERRHFPRGTLLRLDA
jgi:release factor glutamine methyltransferase